ncbi:hypothetical protein ACVFYP_24365 [Roseomonas sp. F4]
MNTKSILLIGFPRGFTSETYRIMFEAMDLAKPSATAGEVLNWQRWPENCPPAIYDMKFFDQRPENYAGIAQVYDDIFSSGIPHLMKDVVQPFHTLRYLRDHPDRFQVLYIRRDLRAVIHSLRKRGWGYVHSIQALDQEFMKFPFLEASRIMHDPAYIVRKIRGLGYTIRERDYLSPAFVATRDGILDELEAQLPVVSRLSPESWPLLESGRRYAFGKTLNGDAQQALLAANWSKPEDRGVWTDGNAALLTMTLPPLPSGARLTLDLGGNRFLNNKVQISTDGLDLPTQQVAISMKGQLTASLKLPPTTAPQPLSITLRPDQTVIPGLLGDTRSLVAQGVRLFSLKVTPTAPQRPAESSRARA